MNLSHIGFIKYIQDNIPGGRYLFNGLHPNFSRLFYIKAGMGILVVKALKIVWPQILSIVFMVPYWALKRFLCSKNQLFQSDLLKYSEKLHTNLWDRYASTLTSVFYTLMFCPGIPLVIPLQAAFIFSQYWFDKTLCIFIYIFSA